MRFFDKYVFIRKITFETDHKYVEEIQRKPLLAASRQLHRKMMQIQRYGLGVMYKKGIELHVADTLSRAYSESPRKVSYEEKYLFKL